MKITQNKINKGIIKEFSQINEKLNEDNCYLEGDTFEGYVIKADVSEEEAYWAMRLIDKNDCGNIDEDDGVQRDWLKSVDIYEGKNKETGESWFWIEKGKGRKFTTKGWVARY